VQKRFCRAVNNFSVISDANIIQNGQFFKKADILKGAGNAQFVDLMRRLPDDLFSCKLNGSFCGAIDAGDEIKERSFTRAVGADDSDQFVWLKDEVEIVNSAQSVKTMGNVFSFKQRQREPPFSFAVKSLPKADHAAEQTFLPHAGP